MQFESMLADKRTKPQRKNKKKIQTKREKERDICHLSMYVCRVTRFPFPISPSLNRTIFFWIVDSVANQLFAVILFILCASCFDQLSYETKQKAKNKRKSLKNEQINFLTSCLWCAYVVTDLRLHHGLAACPPSFVAQRFMFTVFCCRPVNFIRLGLLLLPVATLFRLIRMTLRAAKNW